MWFRHILCVLSHFHRCLQKRKKALSITIFVLLLLEIELNYVHKKLQSPSNTGLNNRNVNFC